ncbi:MAG: DNA translocase FtsK 4TM domain-containing protein [Chloroflexi bacterium]|nr:DNA translocase FtsK 4TM domain-containing protein [Chloroflexota bacterium]
MGVKARRPAEPWGRSLRPVVGLLARNEVLGTVALVGSGLSVLALISPAGLIGTAWSSVLRLLFGQGAYVAPLLFGGVGIALWRARIAAVPAPRLSAIGGWLALFALFETVLQWIARGPQGEPGQLAGGLVGWAIRRALVGAIGDAGALVLMVVAWLVAVALILALPPARLGRMALDLAARWRGIAQERLFPRFRIRRRSAEVAMVEAVEPPPAPRSRRASGNGAPTATTLPSDSRPVEAAAAGSEAHSPAGVPFAGWTLPPLSLLELGGVGEPSQSDVSRRVKQIEQTLTDFDVPARVVEVNPGPTVTQFGVEPGFREKRDRNGVVIRREKVKVSEITSLANDLSLALAAPSIRIEAPVPGRHVVGVEVPNATTTVVTLRQILETTAFQKLLTKARLPLALGEDVSGQAIVADLARMPHLLIAGATGSGKSACINAIIACLLLHTTPEELRMLLIDPKRVEMSMYNDVPHLLRPVVVDVDKVVGVLKWAVHEMEERYKRFEAASVRNIDGYNKLAASQDDREALPYVVIIIDELADLMMVAADDVERLLCRLAQLARATGIHLVVATQRPSVDVITGLIKANFPTRISFAVTSQIDSRTILDMPGAEKLLGRGDMLYMPTDAAKPVRLQGVWVSDDEIEAVVDSWKSQGPTTYVADLVNVSSHSTADDDEDDELYAQAAELAGEHSRVSASLLQRRLRIGHARAARLIERLEQEGVVAPGASGRSREVVRREDAADGVRSPDKAGEEA